MIKHTCTIEECDTTAYVRGYCRQHYRRLIAYGDPLGAPEAKPHNMCSVRECGKLARSKSSDLCKMHYHRQYRGGEVGEPGERKRKQRNPSCSIEGCDKPDSDVGLCAMHAVRFRRHGDVHKVIAYDERNMPMGPDNHNWLGDDAGYGAAHARVFTRRGKASEHSCVECGTNAAHWSYNHDDPDELYDDARSAHPVAYSMKVDSYSPRCVSCHKRFDLGRKDAQTFA